MMARLPHISDQAVRWQYSRFCGRLTRDVESSSGMSRKDRTRSKSSSGRSDKDRLSRHTPTIAIVQLAPTSRLCYKGTEDE